MGTALNQVSVRSKHSYPQFTSQAFLQFISKQPHGFDSWFYELSMKRAQTIQLYASGNAPKENTIRTVTLLAQSKSKAGTWELQIRRLL